MNKSKRILHQTYKNGLIPAVPSRIRIPGFCLMLAMFSVLILAATLPQEAVAQQTTAISGHSAGVITGIETIDLPDGRTMTHTTSTAQVLSDDPSNSHHLLSQTCMITDMMAADGTVESTGGGCSTTSPDGDLHLITIDNGTWQMVGGTGRFADMTMGGTYSNVAQWSDGQFVNRWEGTEHHD